MTQEQFEALVKRLESESAARPALYRLQVALLAAAGYLYLFFMLMILVGVSALVLGAAIAAKSIQIFIQAGVPLLALTGVLLRSLWVRLDPPRGISLSSRQAPELFQFLQETRRRLKAPAVHEVLVTDDFNAAMVQHPRLGVFGWQKGFLILGLPLMEALTPDQFRSVIGHELGHLSGNHGRFAGWIYRVRQTWMQLLQRLEQEHRRGSGLFTSFFRRYAPYLHAYSFVLARAHEHEADQCAAEVAGTKSAAEALMAMRVKGSFLRERFWPDILKRVRWQPAPPADTFDSLPSVLRSGVPAAGASRWLHQALNEHTGVADTHPSLGDRLRALGYPPENAGAGRTDQPPAFVSETGASAAELFLGAALGPLRGELDRRWAQVIAETWKQRHGELQEMQKKLDGLNAKRARERLTEEERWSRVQWTLELEGEDAGSPLLRELLADNPEHVSANFALGRILLEGDDPAGLLHLEKAVQRNPDCTIPACEILYAYHMRQGRDEEAGRWRKRALERQQLLQAAERERGVVSPKDQFLRHGLDPESVRRLAAFLSRYARLKVAYLVQKKVQHLPQRPAYVIGLVPLRKWYRLTNERKESEMVSDVAQKAPLPPGTRILLLNEKYKALRRALKKVPDSRVYPSAQL